MKTVAIIQARLKSTRLPNKVLADLHGKLLIDHVIQRAQAVKGIDLVVLNVPWDDRELQIGRYCPVYPVQGQEQDVLASYLLAAEWAKADVIIRLTGDCPLLAVDIVERAVAAYKYIGFGERLNYLPVCMPYVPVADGWDCEIFSVGLLTLAFVQAGSNQREHVTTWMRESGQANIIKIPSPSLADWTALKCSVDTAEDLERVRSIMAHLPIDDDFSHETIWDAWQRAGWP